MDHWFHASHQKETGFFLVPVKRKLVQKETVGVQEPERNSKKKLPAPGSESYLFLLRDSGNDQIPCSRAPEPSDSMLQSSKSLKPGSPTIPKPMPSYKGIPWIAFRAWLPYRKVPAANGKQPARLLPQTKRKLKTTNSFLLVACVPQPKSCV